MQLEGDLAEGNDRMRSDRTEIAVFCKTEKTIVQLKMNISLYNDSDGLAQWLERWTGDPKV